MNPAHMPPVDTTTAPKREPQRKPQTQNIFHFCPFWSPKFPIKHQSTPKKNSLLPLFALIRCPFDLVECRRSPEAEANESRLDIYRAYKKSHPPPLFAERQVPFTPIIFRTKNIAKSQPKGLVDVEKFSEIFYGRMFRGKGKPPILWKGGEVLK